MLEYPGLNFYVRARLDETYPGGPITLEDAGPFGVPQGWDEAEPIVWVAEGNPQGSFTVQVPSHFDPIFFQFPGLQASTRWVNDVSTRISLDDAIALLRSRLHDDINAIAGNADNNEDPVTLVDPGKLAPLAGPAAHPKPVGVTPHDWAGVSKAFKAADDARQLANSHPENKTLDELANAAYQHALEAEKYVKNNLLDAAKRAEELALAAAKKAEDENLSAPRPDDADQDGDGQVTIWDKIKSLQNGLWYWIFGVTDGTNPPKPIRTYLVEAATEHEAAAKQATHDRTDLWTPTKEKVITIADDVETLKSDMEAVKTSLIAIAAAIEGISGQGGNPPAFVADITAIKNTLQEHINAPTTVVVSPGQVQVDTTPIIDKVTHTEDNIKQFIIDNPPPPPVFDFGPLQAKIQELKDNLTSLLVPSRALIRTMHKLSLIIGYKMAPDPETPANTNAPTAWNDGDGIIVKDQ